jgi:hypothetical protein
MNLEQIKASVESDKVVCWANEEYRVIKANNGKWLLLHEPSGKSISFSRGKYEVMKKMNGNNEEFFISKRQENTRQDPDDEYKAFLKAAGINITD